MYLNYSKLKMNSDGTLVRPNLRLQKLDGKNIGYLNGVYDLKFKIGFAELSEISFEIPYVVNGLINPIYDQIVGYKTVWTADYGIYLLASPETNGSGLEETKTVRGYSIEKLFERKRLFLEEGRYKLYDPMEPQDTILGRVLELDPSWKISCSDLSILSRQQMMDQHNDDALSFLYGKVMESYHCMLVFDPYPDADGKRTIHVYDAGMDVNTLPIYLSYQNLMSESSVKELTDELVTKLSVYGADDLSIRSVNPTGDDCLINLDYFIANGDIPPELASKVRNWENEIASKREYYAGLTALRASTVARGLTLQSDLIDLKNEKTKLVEEQNAIIQKIALSANNEERKKHEEDLVNKTKEISGNDGIEKRISDLEDLISSINSETDDYKASLEKISANISYKGYFTDDERRILDLYMIEDTVTESSFVASDVATESGMSSGDASGSVTISGASISEIALGDYNKVMYAIAGGSAIIENVNISGNSQAFQADLIRGTMERNVNGEFLCSLYLGSYKLQDLPASSVMVTISGISDTIVSDIANVTVNEVTTREGSNLSFLITSAKIYLTADVSEYQKYSEAKELYDYGMELLAERAHATYEFSIDTSNFLFQKEFEAFKDKLQLGSGVYLMLGSMGRVVAPMIGMDIDFDDATKIELTFSNRFQRIDGKKKITEMVSKSFSSSRSFDASKYVYKHAAQKTSDIDSILKESLDAANRTILAASNQSVIIDGGGIHVLGENGASEHQLRIINNMIAMTDDSWKSSRLAIGLMPFNNGETTIDLMGVNAEVLMGDLIIGKNMHILNESGSFSITEDGVVVQDMDFVVTHKDADGKITSSTYAEDKAATFKYVDDTIVQEVDKLSDDLKNQIENVEQGIRTTYYQDTDPALEGKLVLEGDLWFDTSDTVFSNSTGEILHQGGKLYRYTVSATEKEIVDDNGDPAIEIIYDYDWKVITDDELVNAATAAAIAAGKAQATADSKIKSYYQDTEPTDQSHGDYWYVTNDVKNDDGNIIYPKGTFYYWDDVSKAWRKITDEELRSSLSNTYSALSSEIAELSGGVDNIKDGLVTTYYGGTVPTNPHDGDLWFVDYSNDNEIDGYEQNRLYRYTEVSRTSIEVEDENGELITKEEITYEWQLIIDAQATEAAAKADLAQNTADGKINSYYMSTVPELKTNENGEKYCDCSEGDLWYVTGDNDISFGGNTYKHGNLYYFDENDAIWRNIKDVEISEIRDSMITTFFEEEVPVNPNTGDLWYYTGDDDLEVDETTTYRHKTLYRYNGATWDEVKDAGIQEAFDAAEVAQVTADKKMMFFRVDTYPEVADIGDIWIPPDDVSYDSDKNGVAEIYSKDVTYFCSKGVEYEDGTTSVKSVAKWSGLTDSTSANLAASISSINADILLISGKIDETNQAITDGVITSYYEYIYPSPINGKSFNEGDTWYVKSNPDEKDETEFSHEGKTYLYNRVYRYSTTDGWELITDAQATKAMAEAAAAKAAADGTINMFYEDEIPTVVINEEGIVLRELAEGDLWYTLPPKNGEEEITIYTTSKDQPFNDIPLPYEITWDGNTEGLTYVELNDNRYYKVSDVALTDDVFSKGGSCTYVFDGESITINFNDIFSSLALLLVIPVAEDGQSFGDVIFPEAGVYFAHYEGGHTTVFRINRDKTTNSRLDNEIYSPYIFIAKEDSADLSTGVLYVSNEPLFITDDVVSWTDSSDVKCYICRQDGAYPEHSIDWTLQDSVTTMVDVSTIVWSNYDIYDETGVLSYRRPRESSYDVGKLYTYQNGIWKLIEDSAIPSLKTDMDNVKTDVNDVKDDVLNIKDLAEDNDRLLKAVTDGEFLKADTIRGYMEVKSESLAEASGVMGYYDDGLWLSDAEEKEDMTKAVWITGGGIMLGELPKDATDDRSGDPVEDFEWKTAITSGGVMASGVIAGSTVSGIKIVSSSLGIGDTIIGKSPSNTRVEGYPFAVDSDGTLRLGYFEDLDNPDYVQLDKNNKIVRSFLVTPDGKVTARGITFLDKEGNAMMNEDDYQFNANYLNLKGLTIINPETNKKTFEIDKNGNVHMYSGSISWDSIDSPKIDDSEAMEILESWGYGGGTTYIDGASIKTGTIEAGAIKAGLFEGFTFYSEDGLVDCVLNNGSLSFGEDYDYEDDVFGTDLASLYCSDTGILSVNLHQRSTGAFRIYMPNNRYFEFKSGALTYNDSNGEMIGQAIFQ